MNKAKKFISFFLLMAQIIELTAQAQTKIHPKTEIEKKVDSAAKNLKNIEIEDRKNNIERKNLNIKIKDVSKEIEKLDKDIEATKAQNGTEQEQIDSLVATMENIKSQMSSIENSINSLSSKESELKTTLEYTFYNDYTNNKHPLDLFMSCQSFADCATTLEYTKMFANHANTTLNSYNETVRSLNEQKNLKLTTLAALQNNEKNLNNSMSNSIKQLDGMAEMKNKFNRNLEELKNLLSQSDSKSASLENSRKLYENMKAKLEKQKQEKENIEKTVAEMTAANSASPPAVATNNSLNSPPLAAKQSNSSYLDEKTNDKNKTKNKQKDIDAAPSSGFSVPIKGKYYVSQNFHRGHKGVDMPCKKQEIIAAKDGKVLNAGFNMAGFSGYGGCVVIDHGNNYITLYAHMSKINVRPGQLVKKAQLLGFSGNTGRSRGEHLHFEVRFKGHAVDPRRYVKL